MHREASQRTCNDSSPQLPRAIVRRPACEQVESRATRPAGRFRSEHSGKLGFFY